MEAKNIGIALVVVVIIGGIFWANQNGLISSDGTSPIITVGSGNTDTDTDTDNQVLEQSGDFIIKTAMIDTKDQTTARTDGTNLNALFYQLKSDGSYQWKGTSSSNSVTFGLDSTLTKIQAMLEVPDGQAFLVDLEKTANQSDRIGAVTWADPDKDNTLDPVIPIDVVGVKPVGTAAPTLHWTVFLLVDDGTNMDLNDPANTDTDALGTGKQDCAIDWSTQFSANARGALLQKFDITINGTDEGKIVPNESYIDIIHDAGEERIKLTNSGIFKNVDNSNSQIIYEYQFGDGEVADGKLYSIDSNQSVLKADVPVNIKTNFASGDSILNVTLGMTWMDAQGEPYTEDTDLVICAKA